MKKKILIGVPVKDFINPMSRLKEILELNERIQLQKSLIQNIVSSFKNDERDIFLISNDNNVENFANELEIKVFKTAKKDLCTEIIENQIIITSSKDNGTPIIGGIFKFNNFRFGKNSFFEHKKLFIKNKIEYSQLFLKELSFEIDNPDDYENFLQHKPRWFRKRVI